MAAHAVSSTFSVKPETQAELDGHRLQLTARLAELHTTRQTMEAEEVQRRQKDLDAFEASLAGEEPDPDQPEQLGESLYPTR